MKTNPYLRESNDPVIERAACDLLDRAAQRGQPLQRGASLRIGNLVMVCGVPMTVSYYEVFKRDSGEEDIGLLAAPTEDDFVRLCD